jgi:prepilin peptidase CpaA
MDALTMKIRNFVVVLLLVGFAALAPLAGLGVAEIGWSAGAGALVLLLGFGFFALGWIGGGDVKLAAASTLWIGAERVIEFFTFTALFGGLMALLLLQMRGLALPAPLQGTAMFTRLDSSRPGVPYGLAMALAVLVVFPQSPWMHP